MVINANKNWKGGRVTLKNKGGDTVVDAGGAGVVVYVGIDINASFFVIL